MNEDTSGTTNASWVERKNAATPRGVAVRCDFYAERAENAEIWDIEGKRYIDFASGVAVNNVGHRHPKVLAAVQAQLDKIIHTSWQITPYASYVALAEKLNARVPGAFNKKTTFFTTGAEAVENAIKIARGATNRRGIVAFDGGFHGRTMMGMALTGKVAPYRQNFGPMPAEVYHVPYPNPLHGVSAADSLAALDKLFKVEVAAHDIAAIILEPVQGEGGFVPAPTEFVTGLRKVCDENGILMIADEIQTGFGRTGKLFAMEHFGVSADLTTMAKSIAGGMPLSAVCGRAEVMDAPAPGGLGGTFAGNAVAIAAGHAVLDIIDSEKLLDRANALGERMAKKLKSLATEVPAIAEIRVLGSMVAVEFFNSVTGKPDGDVVNRIRAHATESGLLLLACGLYGNVIRFLHPLTISDALLDEGLNIFAAAVHASMK